MTRRIALLALTIGCSAEVLPSAEQAESEISRSEAGVPLQAAGLMPAWRVGDTWMVRYHFELAKRPQTGQVFRPGTEVFDQDWEHRVEWIADGYVAITATHVDTIPRGTHRLEGTTRLRYRANAELVEVAPPRDDDRIRVRPKVHFPRAFWEDYDDGRSGWPQFPLVEGSRLELDQGFQEAFDQTVTREERGLRVTVTRRYEHQDEDLYDVIPPRQIVQTMHQVWEPNRPWWSSIRIYNGDSLHIEGDVIEWHPAKP